jgi:PPK2 family polyphosphate:nucleotide phosphotransferase
MIDSPYLIRPGKGVRLDKFPTDDTGDFKDKDEGRAATEKVLSKLDDLQEILYGGAEHALLIVLQAMDGGGKDGTIRSIFSGVNPQGCSVTSFKAPSHTELAHDFLWRIHAACPARGMIGIFNRSHYESVGVERVKKLVPKEVWSQRYDHINHFEEMLHDEGTRIVKFWLHISKDEQKQRMEARLKDKSKHWKFDPNDLETRKQWDDYMEAYSDAISKCSTRHAPWYVVPADHKWFRNWVVADVLVRTLEKMKLHYPSAPPGIEKIKID